MMRRLTPLASVFALLLFFSPIAAGFKNLAPAARLVAIGDVHGATEPFAAILARAGLIDAQQRWAGGSTVFVQTGDLTDRGAGVRSVLELVMTLEQQAPRTGGQVHVLVGNHEFMNLLGDTRDVTPEIFLSFADGQSEARRERGFADAKKLRVGAPADSDRERWMAVHPAGLIEYRAAFAPNGRYGKWLRSKPAAVRIDDSIFMHAGLDPQWPAESIEDINRRARTEMRNWDTAVRWMEDQRLALPFSTLREILRAAETEYARLSPRPDLDPNEIRAIEHLKTILSIGPSSLLAATGPLWFRGFNTWTDEEGAPLMAELRRKHQARRFIVGHSVQPGGRIRERFDGGLFLIDTGMIFPKGRASALELAGGKATVLYAEP